MNLTQDALFAGGHQKTKEELFYDEYGKKTTEQLKKQIRDKKSQEKIFDITIKICKNSIKALEERGENVEEEKNILDELLKRDIHKVF